MHHRHAAIAIIAAATLTLAGCGSDNGGDKPKPAAPQGQAPFDTPPAAAPSAAPAAKPPAGPPAPVTIGQPVTLLRAGGSGITMTAVSLTDPATATETFGRASAGMRLVAVQWKITSSGTLATSSSPAIGSAVIDSAGQQYPATMVRAVTAGQAFPGSVSIAPGDSRLGWVTYMIPADVKIAQIQYSPGIGMAEDTGTWTT